MPRQILFLDKDDTLGDWSDRGKGFYQGSKGFLRSQHQQGRELHILTTSGDANKVHVSDISDLLSSYMGRNQIRPYWGFYERGDGTVRRVDKDYEFKRKNPGSESGKLVHKETRTKFSEDSLYHNPHVERDKPFEKDLHLARRLLSQENFDELHVVMVGDTGDEFAYLSSDPYTPLFVIQQKLKPRYTEEWKAANVAVDALFGDGKVLPWQVYDNMLKEASPTPNDRIKILTINQFPFSLEIGKNNTRSISWNYNLKT